MNEDQIPRIEAIELNTCSLAKQRWDARTLLALDRISTLPRAEQGRALAQFLETQGRRNDG